jgi:hypothetical protein
MRVVMGGGTRTGSTPGMTTLGLLGDDEGALQEELVPLQGILPNPS